MIALQIQLKDQARVMAKKQAVAEDVLFAIIETESAWNPCAMRYEARWKYLFHPKEVATVIGITAEVEEYFQKYSYGLCQVMGSVARELGFKAALPLLLDPEQNLLFGCMKLRQLIKKYGEDSESDIIAAYNAGSARKTAGGLYENQRYVDKVWNELLKLRGGEVRI